MNPYDYDMGVTVERPKRKPQAKRNFGRSASVPTVCRSSGNCGGAVGERYAQAIDAYGPGATWDETITYWGTALYSRQYDLSEMDEDAIDDSFVDEIAETIRADVDERGAGVPSNRVADVRRGVVTALRKMIVRAREWREHCGKTFTPRMRKPSPPPKHAAHVRNLLDSMGACDSHAVREMSPCWDWFGKPPTVQTAMFLRAAFRPDEILHVFRDDVATAGKPGENLRTAADWVQAVERGERLPGDLIVPNPFTGERGPTTAGKPSFIAQGCLAAFPFAVVEMDDAKYAFGAQGDVARGLRMQCAFWRAFIMASNLAPALVALTYSGGKSIHGLLNVGAETLDGWKKSRDELIALFATDPTCLEVKKDGKPGKAYPYRIDVQALKPRQGTRLSGVRRFDNGRRQELLYLNPDARTGTMWRDA